MGLTVPQIAFLGIPLVVICLTVSASAEGVLPVDLKKRSVTVEHVKLDVSEAQELEMDIHQTVTLSPAQWTMLRKKGLILPMRLGIVDYDANTCGCALLGYTAIRLSPRTLGIPLFQPETSSATDALAASTQGGCLILGVDRRGQFYADGILVPFAELLTYLREKSGPIPKNGRPSVFIDLPVDINRSTPAVKERIDQIESTATTAGWDFSVAQKARA